MCLSGKLATTSLKHLHFLLLPTVFTLQLITGSINCMKMLIASSLWLLSWIPNSNYVNLPEKDGCTQVTVLSKVSLLLVFSTLFQQPADFQVWIRTVNYPQGKGHTRSSPHVCSVTCHHWHSQLFSPPHSIVRCCLYCSPGPGGFVTSLTWALPGPCWVGSWVLLGVEKQVLIGGVEALLVIPFALGFTGRALWSFFKDFIHLFLTALGLHW